LVKLRITLRVVLFSLYLSMFIYGFEKRRYLDAIRHNLTRIYFGGFFIRDHPDTMHRISYAVDFCSKSKVQVFHDTIYS
jgi:pantothenate kinase